MPLSFSPFEKTFLTIGPLSLKYYGLMYVLGTVFVYFTAKFLFRKNGIKITEEQFADLVTDGILGVILGGRIGYILFYNLSYYVENPLKIFAVWEGGMSFHGGFLGVILAGIYFCRKHKFNFYELADLGIIPVFIALALGRLGNFINGELVGRITTLPWGMQFENYAGLRHPSQLYEFGKNILIFGILLFLLKFKFKRGTYFWLGILFYGLFRFLIEFTREPDLQIGFIFNAMTMGQMLSLPMLILGLTMMIITNKKKF